MTINQHGEAAIRKYLETTNPEYALSISGKWGSGKTHLIKKLTNGYTKEKCIYVSLFGIATRAEFHMALLKACKIAWGNKVAEALRQTRIGIPGIASLNLGGIISDTIAWEVLARQMPDILVIDDIERCKWPVDELFGFLNQLVEHERKQIILIENPNGNLHLKDQSVGDEESAVGQEAAAIDEREKLIGQTVIIEADFDTAFGQFVSQYQTNRTQRSRQALHENQHHIKKVFVNSKYSNLRLLKRAIRDCFDLLDNMPEGAFAYPEKISILIQSFLIIHMAFNNNDLTIDDLEKRGNLSQYTNASESRFASLYKRHPSSGIEGYGNPVLPNDIALHVIGYGHMSADQITDAIQSSSHFTKPDETPLWRRAWDWRELTAPDAVSLMDNLEKSLRNGDIVQPGELLHVYSSFFDAAEQGAINHNADQVNELFMSVISDLKERSLLMETDHKGADYQNDRYQYGFNDRLRVSYGGWTFEVRAGMDPVIDHLKSCMDDLFEAKIPAICDEILEKLKTDPNELVWDIADSSGRSQFPNYPIYSMIAVNDFAARLYDLFQSDRQTANLIGDAVKYRLDYHRTALSDEVEWAKEVGERMIELGASESGMARVQAVQFATRYLGYEASEAQNFHTP